MTRFIILILYINLTFTYGNTINVGSNHAIKSLTKAISIAKDGDTIFVHKGIYREGNIIINKRLILIGKDYPTFDGEKKVEVFSIKHDSVIFKGFKVINGAYGTITDPAAIKTYTVNNFIHIPFIIIIRHIKDFINIIFRPIYIF